MCAHACAARRGPWQATSAKLTLLMVNRRMFNATIGDAILKKRAKWKEFLMNLPVLGPCRARHLRRRAPAPRSERTADAVPPARQAPASTTTSRACWRTR